MTLNRVPAGNATPVRPCTCECGCVGRQACYPTDLTDAQWAVLESLLPVMLCQTVLGGRPEKHHRRTIVDALFYLVDNGIKWRALPKDFPPWRTVYGFCRRWRQDKVTTALADDLRAAIRRGLGRNAEPSAGIIDAQSVAESAAGSSSAPTPGSPGAAAAHATTNGSPASTPPWSNGPPSS